MEKMKKYIWSSTLEPAEFEKGWKSVLKKFKLEGNKWLWEMYAIRTSWIPAFFIDKPMFGLMRTTSSLKVKTVSLVSFISKVILYVSFTFILEVQWTNSDMSIPG